MRKVFVHATIVSPGVEQPAAWLAVEDGRISATGTGTPPPAAEVVDVGNRRLFPGFIDIHCHGADGCDVCDDDLDSLHQIARRKLREGVTTWLPTTLTQPREKLAAIAEKVGRFRKEAGFPRCPGLHLEGPFLHPDRAGAQNPRFLRPPDWGEIEDLSRLCPIPLLSLAPELPGAPELIRRARETGIVCSAAHTTATAAQIRTAVEAGLRHLTHFGNAMSPLHHREIGTVGEGLRNPSLMLEIIADGIHLAPDMLRLLFELIPLDRLMLVTDSTAGAWLENGDFEMGGLPVEVREGTARLKHGGALAGSTLRYNEGLRLLAQLTGRPLAELVAATSANQARSLGLAESGRLEPGFHADLAIVDDDFSVWKTFVAGEER